MSDASLRELAKAAGINPEWSDAFGQAHQVSPDSLRAILNALGLPASSPAAIRESLEHLAHERHAAPLAPLITGSEGQPFPIALQHGVTGQIQLENGLALTVTVDAQGCLPPLPCGYHRLALSEQEITLAVAPHSCPSLETLTGKAQPRLWGLATQLYSLRGAARGHGDELGDALAVEHVCQQIATHGGDAVGISPVHAMSTAEPARYSPYSPSSRRFLNILHGSPQSVLGTGATREASNQASVGNPVSRTLQIGTTLIDWPQASDRRIALLRALHHDFMAQGSPLRNELNDFILRGGESLRQFCCFEALSQHRARQGDSADWRQWPTPWQDPGSDEVKRFAHDQETELHFHAFAQWIVQSSLSRAQKAVREAGMKIGLISDLAVGVHGGGADTWARRGEFLPGVNIGAPPDLLNQQGQDWSLAALSPTGTVRQGFRTFLDMLRANLAFAGGIRIDHIMGLQRLWVIPPGQSPLQGAYLNYPFTDHLRLLALEAHRHRALVIGEDLGTVPCGLRETLAKWNILGTRVLFFEQHQERYLLPHEWSSNAMATTTTHDLPSVIGWFRGKDIHWHVKAGHRDPADAEHDLQQRRREAESLASTLEAVGVLQQPLPVEDMATPGDDVSPASDDASAQALLNASITFVAQTPAPLVLLPMEDLIAADSQPNLPGPGNIHPNWRRVYPASAEVLLARRDVDNRIRLLKAARQKPGGSS